MDSIFITYRRGRCDIAIMWLCRHIYLDITLGTGWLMISYNGKRLIPSLTGFETFQVQNLDMVPMWNLPFTGFVHVHLLGSNYLSRTLFKALPRPDFFNPWFCNIPLRFEIVMSFRLIKLYTILAHNLKCTASCAPVLVCIHIVDAMLALV